MGINLYMSPASVTCKIGLSQRIGARIRVSKVDFKFYDSAFFKHVRLLIDRFSDKM